MFIGVLDAFSASVSNGPMGLTTFSNIFATNISGFNGSSMSVQIRGLYWMHISVTIPAYTVVNVTLSGVTNHIKITQSHGSYDHPDSPSRNGLIDLQAGTTLSFLSSYLSQSLQWTSFRLDNIMSQLYAFQVAKSSVATCCGQVTYDLVFLNIGSAWNIASNSFIAPRNGQYFISMSAGCFANQVFNLNVLVNGNVLQTTQNAASSKFSSGTDLHSVSKLFQFNLGDTLTTTIVYANLNSDLINLQTSLAGFLYSPAIISPVSASNIVVVVWHRISATQ